VSSTSSKSPCGSAIQITTWTSVSQIIVDLTLRTKTKKKFVGGIKTCAFFIGTTT